MRLGIICPSEIAFRRFMPAVQKIKEIKFVGLSVASYYERFEDNFPSKEIQDLIMKEENDKAQKFVELYGGRIFESYQNLIESDEIDAVYIPLPPALHFKWAKRALECGKHVLVEKPSTISSKDTMELVRIANEKGLAIHENYMFIFHKQLDDINKVIQNGEIGETRLYRISFGFPKREANDFRYNKKLGGGALLDAGGYTIKYANMILGKTAKIVYAQMNYTGNIDVDMYGSAALVNDEGTTVQVAFGMDNNYKCELEVWGSKGTLTTGRILTAPVGFLPTAIIEKENENKIINLSMDDSFQKSITHFLKCTCDIKIRRENYASIVKQAELIDQFRDLAGKM